MAEMMQALGIAHLSSEDRLRLIDELWESIEADRQFVVPQSHIELLDRRIAAADADPGGAIPWEEVRERLRSRQ